MSLYFNDTSAQKNGLIQECESQVFGDNSYGRISNDANLLATFTRYINEALNRVVNLIMTSDGRWQFDDTNDTDFPIATTNLVTTAGSEQQDYSFDVTMLRILRVEVLDSTGAWRKLKPLDETDVYDQSLTDLLKTPGLPLYYDPQGASVFLYPKPLATSVTSTAGLKVWFQRPPSYFTTTDTTKVPGFNSMYHRLVATIASRDYALFKQLSVAKALSDLVQVGEDSLVENYTLRNKDEHIKLSVKRHDWR
jgi:hypothetical protein